MAFTTKEHKNRTVAKKRNQDIQLRSSVPVIKKVDIEEMKASFSKGKKKATKKVEKKAETAE